MNKGPIDLNALGLGTAIQPSGPAFTDLLNSQSRLPVADKGVPLAIVRPVPSGDSGALTANVAGTSTPPSLATYFGLDGILNGDLALGVDLGPDDALPGLDFPSYGEASDEARRLNGVGPR